MTLIAINPKGNVEKEATEKDYVSLTRQIWTEICGFFFLLTNSGNSHLPTAPSPPSPVTQHPSAATKAPS